MSAGKKSLTPLLTEADPRLESEGNLDPLGLYAIADSLGVQLAPGVRERQSHPRYLTLMAVAAAVCKEFEPDTVAVDGVSAPWQVFEWYVVEGLARSGENIVGLPGRDKAARAIQEGLPLSAKAYLKTPNVFGFHGVYRLLAKTLDIVVDDMLGGNGYRLVSAWEQGTGLEGFLSGDSGDRRCLRSIFRDAVSDGLTRGAVARSSGWNGWDLIYEYLHPLKYPKNEAEIVRDALLDPGEPLREQLIRFLVSSDGQHAWRNESERELHEALRSRAQGRLAELLDAVMLYERFARLLLDAFQDCQWMLSTHRQPLDAKALAGASGIEPASTQVPQLYSELSDRLQGFGEAVRFDHNFGEFANRLPPTQWVGVLLQHHKRVQGNKPPNGRAPWFDWFGGGKAMVRPGYQRTEGGRHDQSYVHAYRAQPLYSFAQDLGLL